jgi:hypothetical protein
MANIVTHIRPKYWILVASGSGEKIFPHIFNITSMGKKVKFKKSFDPRSTSFSFNISHKNQQK